MPTRGNWRAIAGVSLVFALLLMGLGSSNPFPKHRFKQRKRGAQLIVTQVDRGLRQFSSEYSRWPLPLTTGLPSGGLLRTDPLLTGILLGTGPGNPKKIKFLPDLRTTTSPDQSGFKPQRGGGVSLVDTYGEELYIIVEAAGPDGIEDPDSRNSGEGINQSVRVFSAGPDKDPTTWEDNLISSRGDQSRF